MRRSQGAREEAPRSSRAATGPGHRHRPPASTPQSPRARGGAAHDEDEPTATSHEQTRSHAWPSRQSAPSSEQHNREPHRDSRAQRADRMHSRSRISLATRRFEADRHRAVLLINASAVRQPQPGVHEAEPTPTCRRFRTPRAEPLRRSPPAPARSRRRRQRRSPSGLASDRNPQRLTCDLAAGWFRHRLQR